MKYKYLAIGLLSALILVISKPTFAWPPTVNTTYTVPQGCRLHLTRDNSIEPGNEAGSGAQVYVVSSENNNVRVRYRGLVYNATQFCR